MLEQILAGLLPTLWDGSFWQLSHYEIDRRELVLKFAPYRLSKQMTVKVGLEVSFNIHNLTNQRYFVAANAAGAFSTEPPPAVWAEPVEDPTVRDLVLAACRRAGLSLNNSQIDLICAAAPYVMAMTRRLRRDRDFREEPANIFRFPE